MPVPYYNSSIMAGQANLFRFGFTRKQEEDRPTQDQDRPSSSTSSGPQVQQSTKRPASREESESTSKKGKKDGPRDVKLCWVSTKDFWA